MELVKIIYFDEGSAIESLDILKGGKEINIEEFHDSKNTGAKVKLGFSLNKLNLLNILGVNLGTDIGSEISSIKETFIKSTLSNTVLTDYLNSTSELKTIIFEGYNTYAYKNSLAWFKMYTPYLLMGKDNNESFDITKLDQAIDLAKGYYEFILSKDGVDKAILRFNIKSFKNNYNLSDIPKMNLKYYTIKVGKAKKNQLDIKEEFKFDELQEEERKRKLEEMINSTNCSDCNYLDVYDVILAGVTNE
ncbi:DUF6414 family protein [Clostridium perfringens]|uniref:Uncharacterized protein n=1 Tax=Clostridium perfringens TaxID=1502 RepID=A0A4Y5T452_CLOPF|nr:DUF6414 family protein [Clostridium perfringens]MCX0354924.1 DUF6414 family protein [Clostridium perfringens]MCX0365149.1 DUF6414 family protein [Clostridium perfringens]MCX0373534.1 DUF6414 family protein [Clostridium perfringens]MCX0395228.1 DUF6414 family protein [Clostridium perfringens]MCX0401190.1 DUF6414 family protein [Clostridium perfringens]